MTDNSREWIKAIQKTNRLLKIADIKEHQIIVYLLKILLLKQKLAASESSSLMYITWSELLKGALDHSVQTGEKLNRAFEQLAERDPKIKEIITGSPDFSFSFPNDELQTNNKIIKTFSNIPFDSDRIYGEIADYIIRTDSSLNKKYGFNLNPSYIAQLIAGFIDPEPGMKVCDFDCRDGTNLIECAKMIDTKKEDQNMQYFGFSQDSFESTTCLLNMALHNVPLSQIHMNTNKNKSPKLQDFIVQENIAPCHRVIGNHLLSLSHPSKKKENGSINDLIKLLTPDGMLALIVPQRMLAVREDAAFRAECVSNDKIESVVRLPTSFSSSASIEFYLITIRVEKLPATKNKILFVDFADFLKYKNEKEISSARVVEIIEKYRSFTLGLPDQKEIELTRFSRVVSNDDVEKSNFILTIQRYVSPPADRIDIEKGYLELQKIQKEKGELEMEMDSCLKVIIKKMK
jgi:type I restriction enzyme M protein